MIQKVTLSISALTKYAQDLIYRFNLSIYFFFSALVEQLLMKMDRELYDYLQNTDMGLMFCHRFVEVYTASSVHVDL